MSVYGCASLCDFVCIGFLLSFVLGFGLSVFFLVYFVALVIIGGFVHWFGGYLLLFFKLLFNFLYFNNTFLF